MNVPLKVTAPKPIPKNDRSEELTVILTFSGGGTRAAALSYGVLKELRDTNITINNKKRRLLDEVDLISSVSGGSFTSAYYGLFGDNIFQDYERRFLKKTCPIRLNKALITKPKSMDPIAPRII